MSTQRGFTLIELMVAVLIGLIVSLAAMTILADSEARRRTQTSIAGVDQSSQFVSYSLDDLLRNAGSGFTQSWQYTFGCALDGQYRGSNRFPLPTLTAPFAAVPAAMGTFRLAPVVILKGQSQTGSDVLVVNSGSAGFAELPLAFGSAPGSSALNLVGTATLNANDLLLVADRTAAGAPAGCLIEQASATFASGTSVTQVTLGGDYYTARGASTSLTGYSADGIVVPLGNVVNGNAPTMTLIGVGPNTLSGTATGSTLYSLDLLNPAGTPVAISDGVVDLRALYGVDNDGDGRPDVWQDPAAGGYEPASLLDGSAAAALKLVRIKAIRIGMIVRTSLAEKLDDRTGQPVSPATLSLFSDLGVLAYTRTLTSDERNYRYRIAEYTVPLRNPLMIAR